VKILDAINVHMRMRAGNERLKHLGKKLKTKGWWAKEVSF